MADRLVHLELHLLCVDDDRGRGSRARIGAEEGRGLLGHARRLALEPERLDVLPARPGRSSRRGRSGSCGSGRARPPGRRRRGRRTALHELLEDVGAVRGAEGPLLAHRPRRCLDDRHVGRRRAAASARRRMSIFSSSGTEIGSRSTGVRHSPRSAGRSASSTRLRVRPALARANSTARRAASVAPFVREARVPAKPQAPPTRTRTPRPSLSPSAADSTSPFFVATCCSRRRIARASAYSAPAARAASIAVPHSSRTAPNVSQRPGQRRQARKRPTERAHALERT